MIGFVFWLIKASLGLAFTHFLYKIFMRKHTHFQLHRYFFLLCILLSLLGPVLNFPISFTQDTPLAQGVMYMEFLDGEWNEAIEGDALLAAEVENTDRSYDWLILLGLVYLGGLIFAALPIINSYTKLIWLIQRSPKKIKEQKISYYDSPNEHTFSAFSFIFLGKRLENLSIKEQKAVVNHEKVHVKGRHSVDVLLLDFIRILFWFHPWKNALKKDIQELHECIADARSAQDRHAYSRLILQLHSAKRLSLPIHAFAYSPIKHRIYMLLKKPSSSLRYLWLSSFCTLGFMFLLSCNFGVEAMPQLEAEVLSIEDFPVQRVAEFVSPLEKMVVMSEYGMRTHPIFKTRRMHPAIDLRAAEGTPIKASASGKVQVSKVSNEGFGNRILIKHSSGKETFYAHLGELKVEVDQEVEQGEIIALSGNSGLSKGPHLHFEIRENGKGVNPIPFLLPEVHSDPSGFIIPMEGKISARYGKRTHPIDKTQDMHWGLDIIAPLGTPVKASAGGVVNLVKEAKGGYGKQVEITHADGIVTKYAHLSEIKVVIGQSLKQGEVLGLCGSSGKSKGPHLHFELMKDGKKVDPEKYLK
ncbi:MAG: peptidoglycan DD-metalloendopeptidase family protein [Bacteroidota bacterium]